MELSDERAKAEDIGQPMPLPMALLRARKLVTDQFRPSLRAHDLSEQQWRVIRRLSTKPFADITELAGLTELLPSSLSRILRDLAARRLIVRATPDGDARRSLAALTETGQALVLAVLRDQAPIHADIRRRLGDAETSTLQRLLENLIETLGADNDAAPD